MLYRFAENGRFGMIDEKGKVNIEPVFLRLTNHAYEGYVVGYKNMIWSFINEQGVGVKHFHNINGLGEFTDGRAAIVKDRLVGYLNKKFEIVVPCKYQGFMSSYFREGLANVVTPVPLEEWSSRKYGFINKKGDEVVKLTLEFANDFMEGLCVVMTNGKFGAINHDGDYVIEPNYPILNECHEGKLLFCENGLWGVQSDKGEVLIEPTFADDGTEKNYHNGFLRICKNDKYTFVDEVGNELAPAIFEDALPFQEGFSAVKKDGKWSVINQHFEQMTDFEFDEVNGCCEGLIGVQVESQWGFVNVKGEMVIKPIYENVQDFEEGIAAVSVNG